MHVGRSYSLVEFLYWTRRKAFVLCAVATLPVTLLQAADWRWIALPWPVLALDGTAASFIVGLERAHLPAYGLADRTSISATHTPNLGSERQPVQLRVSAQGLAYQIPEQEVAIESELEIFLSTRARRSHALAGLSQFRRPQGVQATLHAGAIPAGA